MANQKLGWIYIESGTLKQQIAFNEETGWVFCEDKTRYTPEELDVMEKNGAVATLPVHRVKKIFQGEIVEIKKTGILTDENQNLLGG
jgi:hypothetical protein